MEHNVGGEQHWEVMITANIRKSNLFLGHLNPLVNLYLRHSLLWGSVKTPGPSFGCNSLVEKRFSKFFLFRDTGASLTDFFPKINSTKTTIGDLKRMGRFSATPSTHLGRGADLLLRNGFALQSRSGSPAGRGPFPESRTRQLRRTNPSHPRGDPAQPPQSSSFA